MEKGDSRSIAIPVTQENIDTVEKLLWDANLEHVLIHYRELNDELRKRIREADVSMKIEHTRAIRAENIQQGGTAYLFTITELAALYRIFEKQWINHEDEEANAAVDRIGRILREAR